MLNLRQRPLQRARAGLQSAQRGMVLIVALIVLVLVTLGGLAMMRTVDTTTLLAGNLAFQQAAVRASDKGIEDAINMLQGLAAASGGTSLNNDIAANGYFASLTSSSSPSAGQSWRDFWTSSLPSTAIKTLATDQFGNTVSYVVHRMCASVGAPNTGAACVSSPGMATTNGNAEEAGLLQLQGGNNRVYYRITVRVAGPRRTESYVQAHIAL